MNIKFSAAHTQFLSFSIIGVANTFFHGAILVMAVEYLELDVTVSNAIAFGVANMFSYFANSTITFRIAVSLLRYARFLAASLISLGITLIISLTADLYGLHYLLGFTLIVVCVPIFSFLVMKVLVFSGRPDVTIQERLSQK